jgi:4-amino-4-deoxy-L-arabinose transferase-like glycosyltransferase
VTDREWREASDMRSPVLALALVVLSAALLRLWAIGKGLPHSVAPGESELLAAVVGMMKTGELNPHPSGFPGFYVHVHLALACSVFIAGTVHGWWTSLQQVGPEHFHVWARLLAAAFGIATVLVVFQIGARWGSRHGLLAAGMMAVMPAHVLYSHFAVPEVSLTFLVAVTFLLTLRAAENNTTRAFALAGVTAGLAASISYQGLVALLLPLGLAVASARGTPRVERALASIGACLAAFLLAAPFTLTDLPGFLEGFASGHLELQTAAAPLSLAYLAQLRSSLAWPGVLLAAVGTVLAVRRMLKGPGQGRSALLVLFPAAYFWMLSSRPAGVESGFLPLLPFVCLLAAIAVISGVSLLRRWDIPRAARTALIAGLATAAILPPAVSAIRIDRHLGRTAVPLVSQPERQAAETAPEPVAADDEGMMPAVQRLAK